MASKDSVNLLLYGFGDDLPDSKAVGKWVFVVASIRESMTSVVIAGCASEVFIVWYPDRPGRFTTRRSDGFREISKGLISIS